MRKTLSLITAAAIAFGAIAVSEPAAAQSFGQPAMQLVGYNYGVPICVGPLGPQWPAPCAQIQQWIMQHQSPQFPPNGGFAPPAPPPAPQPAPQPVNNGGGGGSGINLNSVLQTGVALCTIFC